MLQALRGVISPAGDKMSDQVRRTVFMTLREGLGNPEDTIRSGTAGCLGALCKWLSPEQLNVALNDHILSKYNLFNLFSCYSILNKNLHFQQLMILH